MMFKLISWAVKHDNPSINFAAVFIVLSLGIGSLVGFAFLPTSLKIFAGLVAVVSVYLILLRQYQREAKERAK